jgi:MarR-like DNA-binding transcriptional regulator SgrR of sgrS sRNA
MVMGKSEQKFRQNPRKSWYDMVSDVSVNGDFEASFNLKRPEPALLSLLASGYTPVYPCHVSPGDMRTKPTGTGPFKFVEFKANESIKLVKNPDYFKKGLPHLDGIEFTIITNRSTAILGFVAGKFDMTFPTHITIPLLKDVKSQAPNAVCMVEPDQRLDQHHRQFIRAAVRQYRHSPRHGAGARPQGVHLDPVRGPGRHRRHHAARAARPVGDAEGDAGDDPGLRPRHQRQTARKPRS